MDADDAPNPRDAATATAAVDAGSSSARTVIGGVLNDTEVAGGANGTDVITASDELGNGTSLEPQPKEADINITYETPPSLPGNPKP